jgi:hypothetical protein
VCKSHIGSPSNNMQSRLICLAIVPFSFGVFRCSSCPGNEGPGVILYLASRKLPPLPRLENLAVIIADKAVRLAFDMLLAVVRADWFVGCVGMKVSSLSFIVYS